MIELEELYKDLCFIFQNEYLITKSIQEKLFDIEYIQIFVLLLAYFHLCKIPIDILELCISGDLDETDYKEIYDFLSDKWLNKANSEIEDIIYQIENGDDL